MAGIELFEVAESPAYVRAHARSRRGRNVRRVVTSEGIEVMLPIAPVFARIGAFLLDNLIIAAIIFVIALGSTMIAAFMPGLAMSVILLSTFLVRYFYFVLFETMTQGRTPGKSAAKLRVVNRHGRPLTVESIFVRNVTRDVEVLFPILVMIEPRALFPNAPGWGLMLSSAWLIVFALFPLFNRERLRIGDLLAGTMVVPTHYRVPLAEDSCIGTYMRVTNERPLYTFSPDQLDMYGIFELQVLEDVLRQDPRRPQDPAELARATKIIRHKIGWDPQAELNEWQFLHDFYSSLRARRERGMLLGQPQLFKREGSLKPLAASTVMVSRHSGQLEAVTKGPGASDAP